MLDQIPTEHELSKLLGKQVYLVWQQLTEFIHQNYNMDTLWDSGRKAGIYEYKFRKSGKTLCAFYAREQSFGFMVIYGKAEREQFESERESFSESINQIYDEAKTYHDGKWIMVDVKDDTLLPELEKMLLIKKKPKRK